MNLVRGHRASRPDAGLEIPVLQGGEDVNRVYVGGLPVPGKAWLQGGQGGVSVNFEKGADGLPREEVMAAVREATGWDGRSWDELVDLVEAMPKAGRGRPPGRMAANRRPGAEADAPRAWTAIHAAELDPNDMANPLPAETVLVVDDREPSEMVDRLRAVANLKVEIASLESGDYVVPGKLVVERKTAADLASSVVEDSKRLFFQTDRMASSGMASVLLLEGDVFGQTRMSLPSITGTLTYLAAIQGVAVLPTLSLEHTAYTLVKLVRHAVHGLGYDLALRGSGPRDPADAAAFVIEGIPGVSAGSSRALLEAFGSVAGLAAATVEELRAVPGIGPKRAAQIHETLRAGPRG